MLCWAPVLTVWWGEQRFRAPLRRTLNAVWPKDWYACCVSDWVWSCPLEEFGFLQHPGWMQVPVDQQQAEVPHGQLGCQLAVRPHVAPRSV